MEQEKTAPDPALEVQENGETSQNAPEQVDNSAELEELRKKAELAENYRIRAEKAEADKKKATAELNTLKRSNPASLNVEDYIDISASLEGLDQREKSYLAEQHKLTGKSLMDIRAGEDFQFWDNSYKQKVEKEKLSLKPSGIQSESEQPTSLITRLEQAGQSGDWRTELEEKEKLLNAAGLMKNPRPRGDRPNIGGLITRV